MENNYCSLEEQEKNRQSIAFNREYYVNYTDWENGRCEYKDRELNEKGYGYSWFEDSLFFIRHISDTCSTYVMKYDWHNERISAYMVDTHEKFEYIAVNKCGIFLYNSDKLGLFRIQGDILKLVKGLKFTSDCERYIYGSCVFIARVDEAKLGKSIEYIDMLSGKKGNLWSSKGSDIVFDTAFRREYQRRWGSNMEVVDNPSMAEKISCKFIYANNRRVIAGFTGNLHLGYEDDVYVAYIINVDLVNNYWQVYDAFLTEMGDKWGKIKHRFRTADGRSVIFSFDMVTDSVWLDTGCTEMNDKMRLSQIPIEQYMDDERNYSRHFMLPIRGMHRYDLNRYYFDGNNAYVGDKYINSAGDEKFYRLDTRYYSKGHISVGIGTDFTNPCDEGQGIAFRALDVTTNECRKIKYEQLDRAIGIKKAEPENIKQSVTSGIKDEKLVADLVRELVEFKAELDRKDQFTLGQFRELAPQLVGGREELLEYRKSLPQKWDYNAFVGILLGLHARKVGDAASANFAFGQGDNNKSVDKKFDEHGLWDIFNKYKKCDGNVKLSQVEDEIVAYVPEYRAIREKFDTVLQRLLKDAGM